MSELKKVQTAIINNCSGVRNRWDAAAGQICSFLMRSSPNSRFHPLSPHYSTLRSFASSKTALLEVLKIKTVETNQFELVLRRNKFAQLLHLTCYELHNGRLLLFIYCFFLRLAKLESVFCQAARQKSHLHNKSREIILNVYSVL